ncbi:ABC transporter permease [Candidatus Bipolaricaulota bacterium]|nr:ABC transporter permease [Candidatus Bipolaricaulota bacterium]
MWQKALINRLSRRIMMLVGFACVAFGLTLAIAARNGVEHALDTLIEPIGRNLYRIPSWREDGSRPDEYREGFGAELFQQLERSPGIDSLCGQTIIGGTAFFVGSRSSGNYSDYQGYFVGVSAHYFALHDLSLALGRYPKVGEGAVAVVKQELVESLFDKEDPIGRTICIATDRIVEITIVGVLAPISEGLYAMSYTDCDVFVPADFVPEMVPPNPYGMSLSTGLKVMWARVDPTDPGTGLRSILDVVGDDVDVDDIRAWLGFAFTQKRHIVLLYTVSALALLFVATINAGAMGLTAIAQATHGIGIRRAIGARRFNSAVRVFLDATSWAAAGTVIGGVVAVGFVPRLERLLNFPILFNGWNLLGFIALLLFAAIAAAVPAVRAVRIPPLRAIRLTPLRHETHPLRGVGWLLTLSCIVGISAVVSVIALSDILIARIDELFAGVDRNTLVVAGGNAIRAGVSLPDSELEFADLEALSEIDGIQGILGESLVRMHGVLYNDEAMLGSLYRVHQFGDAHWPGSLLAGKLPTDQELASGTRVAVIGQTVAERHFPDTNPVGEVVDISGSLFTIIGVFNFPKSNLERTAGAWKIMIPASTVDDLNGMTLGWIRLNPTVNVEETVLRIRDTLVARHPNEAPPQVEGPAEEMGLQIAAVNGITYGLRRMSLLTLLVSAFGLGSLFWSQAVRRRRQIGIHRTLGASRRLVFWHVFRRSLATTSIAGAVAFAFGLLGVSIMTKWFYAEMSFRLTWLVWGFGSILAAASLGGGIPALWAAKRSPAETIRHGRL